MTTNHSPSSDSPFSIVHSPLKKGYKRTEVGVIPEDWRPTPIHDFAPLQRGFDLPTSLIRPGQHPVVYSNGILRHHEHAMVKGPGVVTGRSGTIGKVHLLQEDFWPHNTTLWVTSFRGNDPTFVYYLYTYINFVRLLSGSGVPTLNRNDVHQYVIAKPPIAEQRAIAEALSDVDGLITALEKLIAKKRAIKQAAMQQLLTGKTRLPGFSGEWETKRLEDIGHFLKGSGVTRHDANSGRIPCVRYGEIYTTHNDYIRKFHSWISATVAATATPLEYGDILFAGSGETKEEIGKCVAFVTDTEVYAGGDILILRPRDVNSLFLGYALNTPEVNRQKSSRGQGDAVVHISATALAQVCLLLPPLEEQTAIATVLSDMDAEIEALEARRDKTKQIKQGMMQQLLSGRIRLVQPDPVVRGGEQ